MDLADVPTYVGRLAEIDVEANEATAHAANVRVADRNREVAMMLVEVGRPFGSLDRGKGSLAGRNCRVACVAAHAAFAEPKGDGLDDGDSASDVANRNEDRPVGLGVGRAPPRDAIRLVP